MKVAQDDVIDSIKFESRSISSDGNEPGAAQVIISCERKTVQAGVYFTIHLHFNPDLCMLFSVREGVSKCLLICSSQVMTEGMWKSYGFVLAIIVIVQSVQRQS